MPFVPRRQPALPPSRRNRRSVLMANPSSVLTASHFHHRGRQDSPAERPAFEFHVGLDGDDELVFLTSVAAPEFIPSTLSRILAELERLHDRVAQQS